MKIELYRQIAITLGAEIEKGIFPVGAEFPSRVELAERFGVTRVTVNRAMEQLEKNGLISARRGAGTVVISSALRRKIALVAPDWLIHQLPTSDQCRIEPLRYSQAIATRNQIAALSRFDGILWSHPDDQLIPKITELMPRIPGIIVNRAASDGNYVVSELSRSFERCVEERLQGVASPSPYLLQNNEGSKFIHQARMDGFVAACRKLRCFYELVPMPGAFDAKVKKLEELLGPQPVKPLYIFADDWSVTGALVNWASRHGLQWKRDIFYIDPDNMAHPHVWGVTTTSIMQDFQGLTQTALEKLLELIRHPELAPIRLQIDPVLRCGDT